MIRILITAAALIATPASTAERTAKGEFTVEMGVEIPGRLRMAKQYTGGLVGEGSGPFTPADRITVYVALETFDGTVDGKRGTFLMMHRGWQGADKVNHLDVAIAPNSGTGELAGITGALDIRIDAKGMHFYSLRYSLPGK